MITLITLMVLIFCLNLIDLRFVSSRNNFRKILSQILDYDRRELSESSNSFVIKAFMRFLTFVAYILKINPYSRSWINYENQLYVSNLSKRLTLEQFIALKFISAIGIGSYMLLLSLVQQSAELSLLALMLSVISFFLPDQWLKIRIKKRKWEIQRDIPSVLITLAVTTDAGLSLTQAIEEVCYRKSGAFVDELRITLQEISIGLPQNEAFDNLALRVNTDEIFRFTNVINQAMAKGASGLTAVLREQASEAWSNRKGKAKELAGKASIKLFFPLISMVLPALLIFLISPAIFAILKFFVY